MIAAAQSPSAKRLTWRNALRCFPDFCVCLIESSCSVVGRLFEAGEERCALSHILRSLHHDLNASQSIPCRSMLLAGRDIDDARYAALLQECAAAISEFSTGWARFDIIALPSTPLPAVPVDKIDESTFPMSRYTRAGNCLDLCGISIPNGTTVTGLPTDLQLMSWSGADARLLDFAERVSQGISR